MDPITHFNDLEPCLDQRGVTEVGPPAAPLPRGRARRVPFTALGAWVHDLRDRLGL